MKKLLKSPAFWVVLVIFVGIAVIASQRLKDIEHTQDLKPVKRPPLPVRAVRAHYVFVVDPKTSIATKRSVVGGIGDIRKWEVLEMDAIIQCHLC